jgi:hypothetical protein
LKLFDRCTKTTPPGRPPPPIFVFNPQTSLKGPPWFKKTSLQRDLNLDRRIDLLKDSGVPPKTTRQSHATNFIAARVKIINILVTTEKRGWKLGRF